jgi:antitoxin component YwqK of YwqJK toxin-antitoxin module
LLPVLLLIACSGENPKDSEAKLIGVSKEYFLNGKLKSEVI